MKLGRKRKLGMKAMSSTHHQNILIFIGDQNFSTSLLYNLFNIIFDGISLYVVTRKLGCTLPSLRLVTLGHRLRVLVSLKERDCGDSIVWQNIKKGDRSV